MAAGQGGRTENHYGISRYRQLESKLPLLNISLDQNGKKLTAKFRTFFHLRTQIQKLLNI